MAQMQEDSATPGPITWCGIIVATCVLLFFMQKMLWLVVPVALALMIYYLLEPFARKMVLSGCTRGFAAATLSGVFLLVIFNALLFLYPMALANMDSWQDTTSRYLSGGYTLVDSVLKGMERQFPFARNAHLADATREYAAALQNNFVRQWLGPMALNLAAGLPSLFLVPLVTYFLLKEGNQLRRLLGQAVPNAFFEKSLYLSHAVNQVARQYFVGLLNLTLIDIVLLTSGFWLLGFPAPLFLGVVSGLLGQIPYLGPLVACVLALLVAGTDFVGNMAIAYDVLLLFFVIRLLDDFVFIPAVLGKSLHLHPLLSILMLFAGGVIAGIAGLMLVLPVLGVVMLMGETLEVIFTDRRLMARHAHAKKLRDVAATRDLIIS